MQNALHGMELPVGARQAFDGDDLPASDRMRQNRARIVRHIVDEDGARAALGAIAAKLGAREPELVAQRHGKRFLLHDVDTPHLPVDIQRDQPFDSAGRPGLPEDGCAEQICGR